MGGAQGEREREEGKFEGSSVRPTLRGVSASTGTFVLQPFVKVTRQSHPPKLSPSHSLKPAPSFLARVSSIKGYTEIGASLFATEKTRLCPRTGNFCFVHRAPPHPLLDKSTPRLTVPLVPLSPSPPLPLPPRQARPARFLASHVAWSSFAATYNSIDRGDSSSLSETRGDTAAQTPCPPPP